LGGEEAGGEGAGARRRGRHLAHDERAAPVEQRPLAPQQLQQVLAEGHEVVVVRRHARERLDVEPHHLPTAEGAQEDAVQQGGTRAARDKQGGGAPPRTGW
jgi:hypothetical protein